MFFGLPASFTDSRAHLGANTFPTRGRLLRGVTFLGPILFPQHLVSVHDHGRLRSSWRPSNCLTHTVASSLVCTSPLAVITVVGLLDVLMVANSAELRSFLLTISIVAPESTTNSLSSGSFVDAAGSNHSSAGEWNVALSFSLSL